MKFKVGDYVRSTNGDYQELGLGKIVGIRKNLDEVGEIVFLINWENDKTNSSRYKQGNNYGLKLDNKSLNMSTINEFLELKDD